MIVALHVVAAVSALVALQGAAGIALAVALLALGLAAARSRALMMSERSVRAIELESANGAVFELANGERFSAQVAGRRYVSRFMVNVPVVRPVRRTILVFRGMLADDAFRRLRIWALWGKLPGVAGKQLPP